MLRRNLKYFISFALIVFYSTFSHANSKNEFKYFDHVNFSGWKSGEFVLTVNPRCGEYESIFFSVKCASPILELVPPEDKYWEFNAKIDGQPISALGFNPSIEPPGSDAYQYLIKKQNGIIEISYVLKYDAAENVQRIKIPLITNNVELSKVIEVNKNVTENIVSDKNNERSKLLFFWATLLLVAFFVIKYIISKSKKVTSVALRKSVEINDKIVRHNEKVRQSVRNEEDSDS